MTDLTVSDVRAELRAMQREGRCYVKARHIAARIEYSPQEIGHRLRALVEDGDLSVWSAGSSPSTYRIEL